MSVVKKCSSITMIVNIQVSGFHSRGGKGGGGGHSPPSLPEYRPPFGIY